METVQLVLMCVLVIAGANAGKINKSERVMPKDTCARYSDITKNTTSVGMILSCGVNNEAGEAMCYYSKSKCDSILDCPNGADEKDDCANKHKSNCVNDFVGKTTLNGEPLARFTCTDGMCISGCKRCDGDKDCLDNSDEMGCDDSFTAPPCN